MEGLADRPDDKERAIVGAARQIFLAQGFDGASMDAIALAANVSKRTVYSRFRSKEALFAASIEETCRRLLPVDVPSLDARGSAREFVGKVAHAILRGILEPDAIALRRIATFEAHRKPALGIAYLEHGPQFMVDACAPLLVDAAASLGIELENPKEAVWQLGALITEPLYTEVLLGKTPDDLEQAIDQQIERGLSAFWKIHDLA